MCACILYDPQKKYKFPKINSINRLVFLTDKVCVLYQAQTNFFCIINHVFVL